MISNLVSSTIFRCWTSVGLSVLAWFLLNSVALAEPDEMELGKAQGFPVGTPATMYAERFKVGSFSATNKILPTRAVPRGDTVSPLVAGDRVKITYRFQNVTYTLDDYLQRQRVTGLLILKDNQIVAEHYRYKRSERDRFISFSMAKSVNSLLIGIALDKGLIASLDDPAEKYVAELKGSGYGQTTIRQLLRMSSGVKFTEEYNGRDDIARLMQAARGEGPDKPLDLLATFRERTFAAGEKFKYASAETTVLGYVLARATKRNIASLTSEWLWRPLGAEADAAWNIGVDGQEQTEGRFNATLRDYGRLGLLLARDGQIGDKQTIPRDYLLEATGADKQPEAFRPRVATTYYGYGYQFWQFPLRSRTFALLGIYGQSIMVQPESKLVMVHLAVNQMPVSTATIERDALWRGVLSTLGGSTEP